MQPKSSKTCMSRQSRTLSRSNTATHFIHVAAGLVGNRLQRKYRQWLGTAATDDCNARDVIAAIFENGQGIKIPPLSADRASACRPLTSRIER